MTTHLLETLEPYCPFQRSGDYVIVMTHWPCYVILLTQCSVESRVSIEREATEKTFNALAPTYAAVHLATLGVLSGPLRVCKANGKIRPDKGVLGMSWAFFVAGTRWMLVSQWKVDSARTSQLMISFYQALAIERSRSSRDNARALREANLGLVNGEAYRHPFVGPVLYWSAARA